MKLRSWTRLGGAALVVGGVAAAAWSTAGRRARATEEDDAPPRAPRVDVQAVEATIERDRHVFVGVVRPRARALLSFVEGGRVVARPVEVGDRVEPGQVIARLDPRPYLNAVRADDAQRRELDLRQEQLARDRDRASRLARDGVTTRSQLEEVESGFDRVEALREAARARVSESRRRRRDATLRAPYGGVVTDVLVEPGELVSPGRPVIRLAGEGREVLLEVPVELAGTLREGDPVQLRAVGVEADDPLASTQLEGRVASVVADAASVSGLYPVIVEVDAQTRAGVGVEAELTGAPREAIRVPIGAVLDPSGRRPFVWTVVDGAATRAWLRLGGLGDALVEVRDGLSVGDRVVVRGHAHLLPGDAVEEASR